MENNLAVAKDSIEEPTVIYPDMNKSDRVEIMEVECSEIIKDHNYTMPLTEEQLTIVRKEIADIDVKLAIVTEKKANAMDVFNAEIKELKALKNPKVHENRTEQRTKTETVYMYVDPDSKMAAFFNGDGFMVMQRRATPGERQLSIGANIKNINNGF